MHPDRGLVLGEKSGFDQDPLIECAPRIRTLNLRIKCPNLSVQESRYKPLTCAYVGAFVHAVHPDRCLITS
jgi:hypothetical protein